MTRNKLTQKLEPAILCLRPTQDLTWTWLFHHRNQDKPLLAFKGGRMVLAKQNSHLLCWSSEKTRLVHRIHIYCGSLAEWQFWTPYLLSAMHGLSTTFIVGCISITYPDLSWLYCINYLIPFEVRSYQGERSFSKTGWLLVPARNWFNWSMIWLNVESTRPYRLEGSRRFPLWTIIILISMSSIT